VPGAGCSLAAKQLELDDAPPGYVVQSQSWAPGGPTALGTLLLILGGLCVVAGLIIFPRAILLGLAALLFGVLVGRTRGELTVTWAPAPQAISIVPPAPDPGQQLVILKQLLDQGAISRSEYDAKKAELLARM